MKPKKKTPGTHTGVGKGASLTVKVSGALVAILIFWGIFSGWFIVTQINDTFLKTSDELINESKKSLSGITTNEIKDTIQLLKKISIKMTSRQEKEISDIPFGLYRGDETKIKNAIAEKSRKFNKQALENINILADVLLKTTEEKINEDIQRLKQYEEEQARSLAHKTQRILLIFMIAGVLLLVVLTVFLLNNIVLQRIQKLRDGIQGVAGGDLTQQIEIQSHDELDDLAASFNKMTSDLLATTVSKKYLDSIIENMTEALIVTTPDSTIQTVNHAATDLLGYKKDELINQPVDIILAEKKRPPFRRENGVAHFDNTISDNICETNYLTKEGRKIPVLFSYSEMLDDKDKVQGIIFVAHDISERKQSEKDIRQANEFNEIVINSMSAAISIIDAHDYTIQKMNAAFLEKFDIEGQDAIGKTCYEVTHHRTSPCSGPDDPCPLLDARQARSPKTYEHIHYKKDGSKVFEEVTAFPLKNDVGEISRVLHVSRDVTEQKSLQSQLLQNQKIESLGRLAGGIAHDFNNLLTPIIGYSEIAILKLPKDDPQRENIKNVYAAAKRAADLVGQLLAFSRNQIMEMKVVDLNIIADGMVSMLTSLIGEDVDLTLNLQESAGNIMADPSQIEQVIMNLVINAKDAMPHGGALVVETASIYLDEQYVRTHSEMAPGLYVLLSISDTGEGMSQEVLTKIFEPFFTTKEKGKGTGLGLATIYGIVKQHNGYIYVYSEPNHGTTFKIYFPVTDTNIDQEISFEKLEDMPCGTETVLVVDDEPDVINLVVDTLEPLGYRLIGASGGQEAIEACKCIDGNIDLLLTDVIMPKMNGRELAAALKPAQPDMTVVFMSGYTDDVIVHHGILDAGIQLINKPLIPSNLARRLREILDRIDHDNSTLPEHGDLDSPTD